MSDKEEHPGLETLLECSEQVTITIRNYLGEITEFLRKNGIIDLSLCNQVNSPTTREQPDANATLVYQRLQDIVQQDEKYYGIFVDYLRKKPKYSKTVSMLDKAYADNGGNVNGNGSLPNPPGHQNEGKQARRHSLQESGEGHSSIQRLPSHSASEPPMKQPRKESLSSGISSDAEINFSQVHSSQKRPLHDVLEESSSKCLRIDSLSSGNTSDVEVDLPQVRSSQKRHPSDALESLSKRPRLGSLSSSVAEVYHHQGRASSRPEMSSHSTIDPSLHHPRIGSHLFGNTADVEALPPESADRKIELVDAMNIVSKVTRYMNLGTQLYVPSWKLNEISQYPPEEQKSRIIQGWFEHDNNPTYGTLYRALKQPSVDDKRAALQVSKLCRTISVDSSVSADGIYHKTTSVDASGDDRILPFNEANVLNAITKVTNDNELGLHLGLDSHILKKIETYPVEVRKQKLVSELFAVKPENCNWTTVNGAINAMKVLDWNDRRSVTTSGSVESTNTITTTMSSLEDFDSSAHNHLIKWNDNHIMSKYSSIKQNIAEKLENTNIKYIRSHIGTISGGKEVRELIARSDDVLEIFDLLCDHHFWHYYDISPLSSITDRFIQDDLIMHEINAYEEDLNGYKACTKICEKIKWDSLLQNDDDEDSAHPKTEDKTDPRNYSPSIRKKLVITLMKSKEGALNITDYTIKYLEEVFKRFQRKFNHSLDAVLHKITHGSITVTWYVSAISAQNTLDQLEESVDFLKDLNISTIFLEGVLIYSESIGVLNLKELDELRLLLAVQDKSNQQAKSFIEKCSKDCINEPLRGNDRTLLMIAAHGGCIDIMSTLINHGASVNQQDVFGWTALSYACVTGHKEAVNYLLEQGADLTLKSKSSKISNALDLSKGSNKDLYQLLKETLNQNMIKAANNANLELLQKTHEMGADIEAVDKEKEGWSALTWASHLGHVEVVKYLLSHGAEPNIQCGKLLWTPLLLACRSGFYEIAKCLLDHRADVDQETAKGWTSLRFAAVRGHTKVGRLLIRRNATVNCLDPEHEYTPMYHAAQDGQADFISMMIKEVPGLDLEFSTKKAGGWIPLMLACKNGHVDAVRVLLLGGANPNYKKHDNVAAIHVASFAGYAEVVKSLMLCDADVNVADEWGVTSLMFAAKQGHHAVLNTLMENDNLDINAQENDAKFSAPFFAIQCKNLDILQELMNSGKVNCEITDLMGKTLLELAHKNHYEDAKQLFEEKYPEEMEKMKSMVSQSSITGEAPVEGALPTPKAMVEKAGSSDIYITRMMERIDNRMGAAGAA